MAALQAGETVVILEGMEGVIAQGDLRGSCPDHNRLTTLRTSVKKSLHALQSCSKELPCS